MGEIKPIFVFFPHFFLIQGLPSWKSIWLHGVYLTRGENQLLWETGGRVSKIRSHVEHDGRWIHTRRRLLKTDMACYCKFVTFGQPIYLFPYSYYTTEVFKSYCNTDTVLRSEGCTLFLLLLFFGMFFLFCIRDGELFINQYSL